MIRINLLPQAERQSKWPVDRLLLLGASLFCIILCGIYLYTFYANWDIDQNLQATRSKYELLKPTRDNMAKATTKQQLFDKKNNILVGLTKERQSIYTIIQHITNVSPSKIWFTEMGKDDKGMVKIKGWAINYPEVAQFMNIMENDQFVVDSVLSNVEKKENARAATFEIVVKPRGI